MWRQTQYILESNIDKMLCDETNKWNARLKMMNMLRMEERMKRKHTMKMISFVWNGWDQYNVRRPSTKCPPLSVYPFAHDRLCEERLLIVNSNQTILQQIAPLHYIQQAKPTARGTVVDHHRSAKALLPTEILFHESFLLKPNSRDCFVAFSVAPHLAIKLQQEGKKGYCFFLLCVCACVWIILAVPTPKNTFPFADVCFPVDPCMLSKTSISVWPYVQDDTGNFPFASNTPNRRLSLYARNTRP